MPSFNAFIVSALENIYISPLELCNLNCRHCYTAHTKNILTNRQILGFINRYQKTLSSKTIRNHLFFNEFQPGNGFDRVKKNDGEDCLRLKSVLFCGGEVFTLKHFPRLVNNLNKKGIFISIITNGTIDRLEKIHDPQNCQLLVSLDGPQKIHDANRGSGNFNKTISFIRSALQKDFPLEIMFLVTPQSYNYINTFSDHLQQDYNLPKLTLNYITYKSAFYTQSHPLAFNNPRFTRGLTAKQIIHLKKHYPSIPAKNFGCFQLSLQSNGSIYGCCESPTPLSRLSDPIKVTLNRFLNSLIPCQSCPLHKSTIKGATSVSCGGCVAPDFLCGYKRELKLLTCQEVVTAFHKTKPQS